MNIKEFCVTISGNLIYLAISLSSNAILSYVQKVFSCDQAALRTLLSVRPSVCPSVCLSVTPFWLYSGHCIIMKFSGVITIDKSNVHARGQGQRSKVKVTEVKTQLSRFRTVTPVWIHIWWWNDAYSLMLLRRGALLFFKVIRQISRSQGKKSPISTRIERFQSVTSAWIHRWIWNDTQSLMQYRRGALLFFKVIHQISRSHGLKNRWFGSNLSKITRPVTAIKSLRFALFYWIYYIFI